MWLRASILIFVAVALSQSATAQRVRSVHRAPRDALARAKNDRPRASRPSAQLERRLPWTKNPSTSVERLRGDVEVRRWYHAQIAKIPSMLPKDGSVEQRARVAFRLRNMIKLEARKRMRDQDAARNLPPPRTLRNVVRRARSKGLRGQAVWRYVLEASVQSNRDLDAALGLR